MSYILDALRKAERDRELSRVPTLVTAHGSAESVRRPQWVWAFTGALALSAVVASGIFWASRHSTPLREVAPSPPAAADASSSAQVSAEATPRAVERVPEAKAPVVARAPGSAVERPPGGGAPVRPEAAPATPPASTARSGRPAAARPTEAPEASRAAAADLRPAPSSTRPVEAPTPAPASGGDLVAAPAGTPTPAPDVEAMRAEPPASAQPVARLTLDVLVYSDVPAERLVFINGRKYVEGQTVDGDAVVEQITPSGAVLRRQGRQLLLQPKLNPYVRPGSP
jgi:general secretion pathway protein B